MTWLMCRLIKFSNDTSQQITTLLYIKGACELNKSHIISTDEDPGLQIESFAVINLRGVSTNKTIICFIAMRTYKELMSLLCSGTHAAVLHPVFELVVSKTIPATHSSTIPFLY